MIRYKSDSACADARFYYHDFLDQRTQKDIPQKDLEHIAACPHCLREVQRLKTLLARAENPLAPEPDRKNTAVIAVLGLHLHYIDTPVKCSTVKNFLPSLAIQALKIRIITPITAHINNCPACSEDLSSIISLGLDSNRLHRLAQLLAHKPSYSPKECSNARVHIPAAAAMHFDKVDSPALNHLSTCPNCRQLVYEQRQAIRADLLSKKVLQKASCENISTADIFDCCVPFAIAPPEHPGQKQSLNSHLRACPACLARIQQLHKTIYAIVERPDSEIVTRYTLREDTPEYMEIKSPPSYEDSKINVEVLRPETAPAAAPSARMPEEKAAKRTFTRFLTPAVAAAVILIVFALFFGTPAKAVELSDIYEAVAKITNVCITRFLPAEPQPRYQLWVSRRAGLKLVQSLCETELSDFPNEIRKTRVSDSDAVKVTSLSPGAAAAGLKSLDGTFGLVPFESLELAPENATWSPVDGKGLRTVVPGTRVYELTWPIEVQDSFRKWRVYVDRSTNLPLRAEQYLKMYFEPEYEIESVDVISYPTDSEIQAVIGDAF